jgi:flagellar basal-body rod modification protein FlgD
MAAVDIGAMTPDQAAAAAAAVAAANKANGLADKAAQTANGSINADFNFFLKMLTTQLTNQDPTAPMDTSQMTQQIATFSGVEQQVQTNSKLDALVASNSATVQAGQLASASNYIGREVETQGASGQVYGGQGAFSYILPSEAKTVAITIKDAKGNIVFEGNGTTAKGRNTLLWDGHDSDNDVQQPDGVYSISVVAKDAAGKAITAETRSVWYVSGFEKDSDGTVELNVADQTVKLDDVLTVRPPTRANLDPGDDTTSGGDDTTTGGDDTTSGGDDTTAGGSA